MELCPFLVRASCDLSGFIPLGCKFARRQGGEATVGLKGLFCPGLQWHPEYLLSAHDRRGLCGFLKAA